MVLTSNKKPFHMKALQYSFPPSRFIPPSHHKSHGDCSLGNDTLGKMGKCCQYWASAFCSLLGHVPKRLVNPIESHSRGQKTTSKRRLLLSGFPVNLGTCPCPQSVTVLQVCTWLQSPGEIQAQSFRAGILSNKPNISLF